MAIITRWRRPPLKLERILVDPALRLRHADDAQQLDRARRAPPPCVSVRVQPDRLDDLVADGVVMR